MRKSTKLMAGLGVVAGLGVALAPLATFADPMGTNNLQVNVNSDCALNQDSQATPQDIVIAGTWTGSTTPDHTIELNGPASGSGVSQVTFDCSVNSKVSVSAQITTALSNGNDTIDQVKAKYTGTNGMEVRSTWNNTYGAISGTSAIVADGTATSAGDMGFTVAGYEITTEEDQEPGTYNGVVTYTFALVNS